MAEKIPTKNPKKWWWLAAVAVPIAVAVINNVSDIFRPGSGGGGNTTNIYGSQFNAAVTFNTINVVDQADKAGIEFSESDLETLQQAISLFQARQFNAAIPLLQSLEEVAPVPAVLNSLGEAHLATGDCKAAKRYYQAMIDRDPNSLAAQNNTGPSFDPTKCVEILATDTPAVPLGTPSTETAIVYGLAVVDQGSAIRTTASVLPTIVVLPLTRFSEPGVAEVLVVSAGTDLRSFTPVQRAKQFDVPMVVEPGVYDLILDLNEQSMIRLVEGLEIASAQQATIDPNAFVSFIGVQQLTLDGFPQLAQVSVLDTGTSTSGYVRFKHSTQQVGVPLLVEPGKYDIYAEPVGGRFIRLAEGVDIRIGEGVAVNTDAKVAVIVHDDPQLQGFELERIYLVTAGTDLQTRHSILQEANSFGQPFLVAADGRYDVVLKPVNGNPVKVQEGVSPTPGEIVRFGVQPD